MVSKIDELEALGLAERLPHPSDRRKHAIHLTRGGDKALGSARIAAGKVADRVLGCLESEEVETLRRLLRKLAGVDGEVDR